MTGFQFRHSGKVPYNQAPPLNSLVFNRFIEETTKGVDGAQNPNHQRGILLGKRLRRPFRELGEVKKESGFDLVFAGSLGFDGEGRQEYGDEARKKVGRSKPQAPPKSQKGRTAPTIRVSCSP